MDADQLGLVDDRLRHLFAYWQEKRAGRAMPRRADIDPLDFPYILGSVTLIEVLPQLDGLPRFRFRLYGTEMVAHSGTDMTGRYVEDFPGPVFAEKLKQSYMTVVKTVAPLRVERRQFIDDRYYDSEGILLPLGEGSRVDMILIALAFGPWRDGYLAQGSAKAD